MKGKALELTKARVSRQHGLRRRHRTEGEIPAQYGGNVRERDRACQHAEMAAIMRERQEPMVEPGQWADAPEIKVSNMKAQLLYAFIAIVQSSSGSVTCFQRWPQTNVAKHVDDDARQNNDVIHYFVAIPADLLVSGAHGGAGVALSGSFIGAASRGLFCRSKNRRNEQQG